MIDRLHQLNFGHLFYFWVVARHGSIAVACDRLHVTQPTISMQIRRLERALGHPLFERTGRSLKLTEVGRTVFEYADDMFAIGNEMLGALRGVPGNRRARLHVGVRNVMPKLITYRLLEPVLRMTPPCQISCQEAQLHDLVADLARHRFDVVLSDTPLTPDFRLRSYNHMLGESSIAICGVPALARKYRRGFPKSLHRAPFILPAQGTEVRAALDRWLHTRGYEPDAIAEFDDSGLLKEFGCAGAGLFPVVQAVLPKVIKQYGVELVGQLTDVRLRFYAITTQRKLVHPAVVVISEMAKQGLLDDPPTSAKSAGE